MATEIRFGGRSRYEPASSMPRDPLAALLGQLSWKYVKENAEFDDTGSITRLSGDELKEDIAHWAGRVWIHSNPLPSGAALRAFDLMSLETPFRTYIEAHGTGLFNEGLTLEEIWASQQLHSAAPMLTVVASRHANLLTARMQPTRVQGSQALVWTVAAITMQLGEILQGTSGFNVLVSDGKRGHTINIQGLNGIDFEHPRGARICSGWFSFHDPWPARSLLAPERNFSGVQALEDVTRPPFWLISPDDLDRIIVGYLLPIDVLPTLSDNFRALEINEKAHAGSAKPLWLEKLSAGPERPFELLLAHYHNVTPTTASAALGLGKTRLLMGDIAGAIDCFEEAHKLGLPGAAVSAANLFLSTGHDSLAKQWMAKAAVLRGY